MLLVYQQTFYHSKHPAELPDGKGCQLFILPGINENGTSPLHIFSNLILQKLIKYNIFFTENAVFELLISYKFYCNEIK